jgi:tetratricopeptide (TPR) repeat protein
MRAPVKNRFPTLNHLVSRWAQMLGSFVGRPSEALLSELASKDRKPAIDRPDSPLVTAAHHIGLGQAAFKAGAYGEALHHFGEALSHAPESPWAWHGRGDALQLSGQHSAALAAYLQAIRFDDSCGLHHAGQANALTALGQSDEADLAWEAALERDPSLSWMQTGSKKP